MVTKWLVSRRELTSGEAGRVYERLRGASVRAPPRTGLPGGHEGWGVMRAQESHVRVRYEETDIMGVVYHANYLRYFEVGRVELLRARGVIYRDLEARGFRLAVVEARATFRPAARFDDLLSVRCIVDRVRPARIDLRYDVSRDGRAICEGVTVLACLDASGRVARIPDEVRCALAGDEES